MTSIAACRVCRSDRLAEILDFGDLVLTGVFPASREEHVSSGRVRLLLCQECGLVQLGDTFPPAEMYGDNYGYRSGLNASMVAHLERIAHRLEARVGLAPGDRVLDIGANDGTLLRSYTTPGLVRVGIDPTIAKFREYYPDDITAVDDFFTAAAYALVLATATPVRSLDLAAHPSSHPKQPSSSNRTECWIPPSIRGRVRTTR